MNTCKTDIKLLRDKAVAWVRHRRLGDGAFPNKAPALRLFYERIAAYEAGYKQAKEELAK